MLAKVAPLLDICDSLRKNEVRFALGGSGLLMCLGLEANVRDWDITTDAPLTALLPILKSVSHEIIKPNGNYATDYMAKINHDGALFDLIGNFALRTEAGVCQFPTIVCGSWMGIPLGSPEVWFLAYRLLGRTQKADVLASRYKKENYFLTKIL